MKFVNLILLTYSNNWKYILLKLRILKKKKKYNMSFGIMQVSYN